MDGTPWSNPLNRLTQDGNNYKGTIYFNGIEFRATLNYQTSGKYALRGRVSAISAITGRVLMAFDDEHDPHEKAVSAEVYCYDTDEASAKTAILDRVSRLYRKHALIIARELQITARPDTIIPSVAAVLYAGSFVSKFHSGLRDSSMAKYIDDIEKFYCSLPQKPMVEIRAKDIRESLKKHNIGKDKEKRLHDFWQFMLDSGHATGVNPFPPPQKRKISADAKQRNVERIDELTLEQQDKMYNNIIRKKIIHGGDCGIAMYMWGGFTVEDGKTWGDLIIKNADESYAVMTHRRDDLSGATHTFDRPLFPQAVQILLRAKDHLLEKYNDKQLRNMPIIGLINDPTRPMSSKNFYCYAGKLLREIGLKEANLAKLKDSQTAVSKRILLTTYEKNLYHRIGLSWDDGALQYLQGLSLAKNVTNDNYTSYSDDDALARMHTAMMAIRPKIQLNNDDIAKDANGKTTIKPFATRERVGAVGSIILPPGASLRITCRHGVTGELRARELLPDGTKKRASPKK